MSTKTIIEQIKESAEYAKQHAKYVKIDEQKLTEFANALDLASIKSNWTPLTPPLRFDSDAHQINFICTLHLINFGSGYRHELHKYCGRGSWETMLYGCVSMVLSGGRLDADYLTALSLEDIGRHFNIPLDVEEPHPSNPILKVYNPSPVKPLAEKIHKVLTESGAKLWGLQCRDFAQFVEKQLKDNSQDGGPRCHLLVSAFVRHFPAFRDIGKMSDGHEVYLCKKAQIAVAELYKSFKDKVSYLNFVDIESLTVFIDNVLPAVLRRAGILVLDPELARKIDNREPVKAGAQEAELRAVGIAACEDILRVVNAQTKRLIAAELDDYLWKLGKVPEYRKFERHATKDTVFY